MLTKRSLELSDPSLSIYAPSFEACPSRTTNSGQPTLWRFVVWPLAVYTFGMTKIAQGSQRCNSLLAGRLVPVTLYQELRDIGKVLASRSVSVCADTFERLANGGECFTWDEAFAQSFVCYL